MSKVLIRYQVYFGLLLLLSACSGPMETYDTLIRNASLIDGLGNPARTADIYIKDGLIAKVTGSGEINADSTATIDARGRVVTPGFIDIHSHGDPLVTPGFENFLAQGVTTITLGQDGSSPNVEDLGGWLATVRANGIGVNLAMFVGHGTLRNLAGIGRKANPSEDELQRMVGLLDGALDYTFGLSTGLEYNPGLHASQAELITLSQTVGARHRVIMSHMRNEDDDQLEQSIAELLHQGRHARVHIAHLKSVYGKGRARAEELLAVLARARAAGVAITADVYPYIASYTGISLLFPVWAKTSEDFVIAKRDQREALEAYLVERIGRRNGPAATLMGTDPYTGKTLADLEVELGLPFEKILIDVIGPQGGGAAYFIMDDELQSRLLQDNYVTVSSDGSPTAFHPRGHGTFAKIIEEYVVARNLLSLEEAIRKMTSFSASILGLEDRGSIEPGKVADLVIFEPENIRAKATYPAPLQLAQGFDVVMVNGKIAFQAGVTKTIRAGSVLKPAKVKQTSAE
ncbi:MAG: amidohydrolase family protein [Gammaproteobacteria bacterium]|jgi:N-acyl-D-amino-acid deacylase|nr:amidohydrolase family protein [Gammaproteobacteria bacterium]MBT5205348.1 amidohydrolase family protein [Gammaproteobacteria bacterium]MBT6245515.1 amidohydrolase family protein [Gammaproteobacteria bacterium]